MKTNRIQFSLEKYESGKYKVVTRVGKRARIVCTDMKSYQPIIAIVRETEDVELYSSFSLNGELNEEGKKDGYDLFLEEVIFEDGDIIHYLNNNDETAIFKKSEKEYSETYFCYNGRNFTIGYNKRICGDFRIATEVEKQRLFDALKKDGKRWNADKKCIEDIKKEYQFKPFDRVLVRDSDIDVWQANLFGFVDNRKAAIYRCVSYYWAQCIPYEGNEELLGTTNSPKK